MDWKSKLPKSLKNSGWFYVVNGTAERGIKLIQDFNSCLTKDEEQRQFLFTTCI